MADELEKREPNGMRASDADREKVAQALHKAMADGRIDVSELDERLATVYKAKTIGELTPVTADLPIEAPLAAQHQPALPNRTGGTPGSQVSVGVLSGFERKGVWTVPPTHTAVAFMGGGELDLSQAKFSAAHTTITCVAFMGGIEVRVPEDVNVHVNGIGFMGAFDNKIHEPDAGDDRPTVKITGLAFMGGVDVKRPKRRKRDRDELES
ncbi:DUF1707 SHOCT-like domain-containing protein [Sciscionella sediminilitoris]|uniref:DUF1707 SHOCT-like domain-containing protein n=1 Tax=Sciscionella sediminilitoris TaxID=1445613 RepID=UPI0004DFA998|nr:DUF1707 domain-containing protein [Sciscionella sp. SE31]